MRHAHLARLFRSARAIAGMSRAEVAERLAGRNRQKTLSRLGTLEAGGGATESLIAELCELLAISPSALAAAHAEDVEVHRADLDRHAASGGRPVVLVRVMPAVWIAVSTDDLIYSVDEAASILAANPLCQGRRCRVQVKGLGTFEFDQQGRLVGEVDPDAWPLAWGEL